MDESDDESDYGIDAPDDVRRTGGGMRKESLDDKDVENKIVPELLQSVSSSRRHSSLTGKIKRPSLSLAGLSDEDRRNFFPFFVYFVCSVIQTFLSGWV